LRSLTIYHQPESMFRYLLHF